MEYKECEKIDLNPNNAAVSQDNNIFDITELIWDNLMGTSNIRVNALSIGLFPSESMKDYIDNDPTAKDYIAQIPAKRAGKLTELDGPILLLASDSSSYMTGSVLKVDGGFAINVFMNSLDETIKRQNPI